VLVSLNVDDEDEGVVVFNLLHCRLGGEWVDNDGILVKLASLGYTLAWVLWCTGKTLGLGKVEVDALANLLLSVGVESLDDSLLGLESFIFCSCKTTKFYLRIFTK